MHRLRRHHWPAWPATDGTAQHGAARGGGTPDRVDVLVNNAGGNTDFDRPDPAEGDLAAYLGR
jgi:hypothetical protein